jgi:hypothetical protein
VDDTETFKYDLFGPTHLQVIGHRRVAQTINPKRILGAGYAGFACAGSDCLSLRRCDSATARSFALHHSILAGPLLSLLGFGRYSGQHDFFFPSPLFFCKLVTIAFPSWWNAWRETMGEWKVQVSFKVHQDLRRELEGVSSCAQLRFLPFRLELLVIRRVEQTISSKRFWVPHTPVLRVRV